MGRREREREKVVRIFGLGNLYERARRDEVFRSSSQRCLVSSTKTIFQSREKRKKNVSSTLV
jgi:hypothetical protein